MKAPGSARYVLDEDHEQIELKAKSLRDSIIAGRGLPRILESAESLIAKVLEHFQKEEMALEAVGYPGVAKHRAAHELIAEHVLQIKNALEERQIRAALNLLKMYSALLREHSEREDSKYAAVIRNAPRQRDAARLERKWELRQEYRRSGGAPRAMAS